MKKLFLMLVVFVLVFGWVSPASAEAKVKPSLTVIAPESGFQGDTLTVKLVMDNLSKTNTGLGYTITLPKTTVDNVTLTANGQKVVTKRDRKNWVFVWNSAKRISGSTSAVVEISFSLTAQSSGEEMPLVKVKSGSKVIEKTIEVKVPTLSWSFESLNEFFVGGEMITIKEMVVNNFNIPLSFDSSTFVPKGATDGTLLRSIDGDGSEVYDFIQNELGTTIFWRGTVPAHGTFTMEMYTFPGPTAGNFTLFEFTDLLYGVDNVVKLVQLVEPVKPSLNVSVGVSSPVVYGGRPVQVFVNIENNTNESLSFDHELEILWAPTDRTSKFLVESSTSTCRNRNVYHIYKDGTSIRIFWKQTLQPSENCSLTFWTASGGGLGKFDLVNLYDAPTSKKLTDTIQIELVQGTEAPHGEIGVRDVNNQIITAGSMISIEPWYYSGIAGQFVTQPMRSTCAIEGLPQVTSSPFGLTIMGTTHLATILPIDRPEGVVGPYNVLCQLDVDFTINGQFYSATKTFWVKVP